MRYRNKLLIIIIIIIIIIISIIIIIIIYTWIGELYKTVRRAISRRSL